MTIFSQSKKINQSQKGILTCVMMKKEGGLYGKKKRKRKEKKKKKVIRENIKRSFWEICEVYPHLKEDLLDL